MRQRAATLWYHDHRMDFTGAAGLPRPGRVHLVRDAEEDALPLPHGERDIPLVIADRSFAADGSFRYPALDPLRRPGRRGRATWKACSATSSWSTARPGRCWRWTAARYRFRVLNASNARRYELELDPAAAELVQIGSDGGLLDAPVEHDTVILAPAERFDVVVDFSAYAVGHRGDAGEQARPGLDRAGDAVQGRPARRPTTAPCLRRLVGLPASRRAEGRDPPRKWTFDRGAATGGTRAG